MDQIFYIEDSKPLIRFKGSGSKNFLHGQTTVDVLTSEEGIFIHSCLLDKFAKVRGLLEIKSSHDYSEVVILAGDAESIYHEFDKSIFPADKVSMDPMVNVRRIQKFDFSQKEKFGFVKWTTPGEILFKDFTDIKRATFTDFERWRLEKGIPLGSGEINGQNNPFELGLSDLVDLKKGCYLGQEVIARILRTRSLNRKVRCWHSIDKVSRGQDIFKLDKKTDLLKNVGIISSALECDNDYGNKSIGLAIVKSQALDDEDLFVLDGKRVSISLTIPPCFKSF